MALIQIDNRSLEQSFAKSAIVDIHKQTKSQITLLKPKDSLKPLNKLLKVLINNKSPINKFRQKTNLTQC